MKTLLAAMALVMVAGLAQAAPASQGADTLISEHSGGTNSSGCHNDHQRGGYHCH